MNLESAVTFTVLVFKTNLVQHLLFHPLSKTLQSPFLRFVVLCFDPVNKKKTAKSKRKLPVYILIYCYEQRLEIYTQGQRSPSNITPNQINLLLIAKRKRTAHSCKLSPRLEIFSSEQTGTDVVSPHEKFSSFCSWGLCDHHSRVVRESHPLQKHQCCRANAHNEPSATVKMHFISD